MSWSRVKDGKAVKVGGQVRGQGWGQGRGRVKVRGVMVGGLGVGVQGQSGFVGLR